MQRLIGNRKVQTWRPLIQLFLLVIGFGSISCSPVQFSKNGEGGDACPPGSANCIVPGKLTHFDYSTTVPSNKVDILFVTDNSASMSSEQKNMASRFTTFVAKLDNAGADYRIAITTTDISSSSNPARNINKNGGLQDGGLIPFADGSSYLTPSSGNVAKTTDLFNSAIVRPETLQCESFISGYVSSKGKAAMDSDDYRSQYISNCPSDDERGIYATNLVLQKNPSSFLRKDANLAIIVLADEDERSQFYDPYYGTSDYALDPLDQPATVVHNALGLGTSKSFSFHSIVVKDSACKSQQEGQLGGLVGASYGNLYAKLTQMTGGVLGDICASAEDYTSQLSAITGRILSTLQALPIKCETPQNLVVSVNGTTPVYAIGKYKIVFTQKISAGSTVQLSYDCP